MHWHKGSPFNSGEVERLPFAPHRSRCTRKFVNQFGRQSDGPRFQRVSSGYRNHGMSDRLSLSPLFVDSWRMVQFPVSVAFIHRYFKYTSTYKFRCQNNPLVISSYKYLLISL